VRSAADGAVVYDDSARGAYPDMPGAQPAPPEAQPPTPEAQSPMPDAPAGEPTSRAAAPDSMAAPRGTSRGASEPSPAAGAPSWAAAQQLEFEQSDPQKAAGAYAAIAAGAADVNVQAQALAAQARCLVKAGQKEQALKLLEAELAKDKYRSAVDPQGRLIAPGSQLFALQIGKPAPEALSRFHQRLSDYSDKTMPSAQRRFLMQAFLEMAAPSQQGFPTGLRMPPGPSGWAFDTLAAEELSAEYLQDPRPAPEADILTPGGLPGLWQMASPDKKIVLLFRQDTLMHDLRIAGRLDEPFVGITREVLAPGAAGRREPFLTVPASKHLPGWELAVYLVEDPFAEAAGKRKAVYLWTGTLGVCTIAALAMIVAGYIGRQMKLTRLKNDLIATVSHELKTPLASMRVLVDTLLEGRCRDAQQAGEYFRLIAKENERLSRLIDNFLTFSRMERNKQAFEFACADPGQIVRAAVEAIGERFTGPGAHLEVEIAPNLPAVYADRDAMITVVLNLLDNAWKYTGDEKRIRVRVDAADGGVSIEITDNGIGLSRRQVRRIFDRFYQADQTLSRKAGGCGLGLAIVKFILDAHGGTIDVSSQQGKGSTFTVRLPAAAATTAERG